MTESRADLEARRTRLLRENNRLQEEKDRIARTEMFDISPTSRTPAEQRYIDLDRQQDAVIDELHETDRLLNGR